MSKKIEEAFNECFERLAAGESLDSCLSSYPEYAAELDSMLRTTFDIKRRVYPVQPRPEFKYWARVRLQGVQDYVSRQPVHDRSGASNLRRNLAISVAAILVFVIASSGTAAASSDALPDEPLYGVKLAVEQAQVTFALSDVDKAELYANLAEKRAAEIVAMARQGKTDKVVATTTRMNYQLDQAEQYISKYAEANAQAENSESAAASVSTTQAVPPASTATVIAPAPAVPAATGVTLPPVAPLAPTTTNVTPAPVAPPAPNAAITADKNAFASTATGSGQDNITILSKPGSRAFQAFTNINKAKNTINASTAKSLAILQSALDKAPDSEKSALQDGINHTKKANEWSQKQLNAGDDENAQPTSIKPNIVPPVSPDKSKFLPLHNSDNKTDHQRPYSKPVSPNLLPQGNVGNQGSNTDNDSVNNLNNNIDDAK